MKIKQLAQSEIFRHISILVSGTVLAQLIPISLQVFLRRLYPAELFGAMSVLAGLTGIFLYVFTLSYEFSIINPKDERQAHGIFKGVMLFSWLWTLIGILFLLFFQEHVIRWVNFPKQYAWWLYLLPLSVGVMGVYQGLQYLLIRQKAFKAISVNKLSRRAFEGISQLFFGIFGIQVGLLLGQIIGNLANVISGFYQVKKKGINWTDASASEVKLALKTYKNYPLYYLSPALFNTIGVSMPIIYLNKFYGTTVSGYFDLMQLVLTVPSAFLSVAISQVFLQNMSERYKNGQSIRKNLMQLAGALVVGAVLLIAVFSFFGEELYAFVFGDTWRTSGQYAEWMVFKYALVFVVSPISSVFIALEKIKISSMWQIFYFLMIMMLGQLYTPNLFDFLSRYIVIDLISYSIYFGLIVYVVFKYERSISKV